MNEAELCLLLKLPRLPPPPLNPPQSFLSQPAQIPPSLTPLSLSVPPGDRLFLSSSPPISSDPLTSQPPTIPAALPGLIPGT